MMLTKVLPGLFLKKLLSSVGTKSVELIESKTKSKSKSRVSWARLLKRVFNIDVTKCNKCSGQMKIIAAIEDPKVIKKILSHLGLPTKAPTALPVRGPPSQLYDYKQF